MGGMVTLDMRELADGSTFWADGQLQSVGVNPNYGTGYLSEVRLFQRGISIVIQNFYLYGNGEIRLTKESEEETPRIIGFVNSFSGIRQFSKAKYRVPVMNGDYHIEMAGYEPTLFLDVKSNTPVQALIVCMDPTIFTELTGKSSSELVEAQDLLNRSAGEGRKPTRKKSLYFAQKLCGYQALASFMDNPRDTLFLEAKALELVALQLKQLELLTGKTLQTRAVDHHAEKISYACEILRKEMVSPSKVLEIARRVGLNHNQLIQGFREILGVSPFEYLRIICLEKARDLIASHECNVTEAALKVGYSSLSHFTKTFRKKFGINPKALAQEKNKKFPC